jgi:hypothetical protein
LQYLEGQVRVVLKRNEEQVIERLLARVDEKLGKDEERNEAIGQAFVSLIKEFKDETIRLV